MRIVLMILAVPILVGYGVAEGVWTNRWHNSQAVQQAVDRLRLVPAIVGDWQGQDLELDHWQVEQGEIDGYLMRHYVNQVTGEGFTVLIVCGRPGPIALHPPDICYQGAGYQPAKPPQRVAIDAAGVTAEFWQGDFRKPDAPVPDRLDIRWSWSATGEWRASNSARMEFARHPALYKFYLVRKILGDNAPAAGDPGAAFLQQFLPELNRQLFGSQPT
jgi:hypothetical protein